MKKVVIVIAVSLIVLTGFLLLPFKTKNQEVDATYLRVHIRANSNDEKDQNVKYLIKDSIVSYLTPKLKNINSLIDAKCVVEKELKNISTFATEILKKQGFAYDANAKLNTEYFPTRCYEDVTLVDGFYDALIVELGSAEGDNWWCVVYPPLCFNQKTNEEKIVYKSIIMEIIEKNKES